MKTMIEVQYQEKNVKNGDLDKYVKETLKEQGVKTTEVETLNIYYLPETAKVFFVVIKTCLCIITFIYFITFFP